MNESHLPRSPRLTYALYPQAWQLRASDISLIYVLYMCGGLCALLFLGRLPDRIGFQRVMLCFWHA